MYEITIKTELDNHTRVQRFGVVASHGSDAIKKLANFLDVDAGTLFDVATVNSMYTDKTVVVV